MRAAVYERCGPPREVLSIQDMPEPQPANGEVRVRVVASGVNPHDTKRRSGWTGLPPVAPRVIPHGDAAGVIDLVGAGVPASRIGERVWLFQAGHDRTGEGAAAEFCCVRSANAVGLPEHIAFEVGAGLGVPAMTAHRALFADGPVTGQDVLITGAAGAVGAYAVQLARWNGARVIATVSSSEKARYVTDLGADTTIDYRSQDVAAEVFRITNGRGVDRIIEVDFGANIAACHATIRPGGTIASYSSTRERSPTFPYYAFAAKGVTLRMVQCFIGGVEAGVRDLSALLARDLLKHRIAATFPLKRIADAHAMLEAGGHIGKIIVTTD